MLDAVTQIAQALQPTQPHINLDTMVPATGLSIYFLNCRTAGFEGEINNNDNILNKILKIFARVIVSIFALPFFAGFGLVYNGTGLALKTFGMLANTIKEKKITDTGKLALKDMARHIVFGLCDLGTYFVFPIIACLYAAVPKKTQDAHESIARSINSF